MENVYIISASYGEWDDHTSVDVCITTGGNSVVRLDTIVREFTTAYRRMIEAMIQGVDTHDADMTGVDEHIAKIAQHDRDWETNEQQNYHQW